MIENSTGKQVELSYYPRTLHTARH